MREGYGKKQWVLTLLSYSCIFTGETDKSDKFFQHPRIASHRTGVIQGSVWSKENVMSFEIISPYKT
jgi:hypothetical protein